MKQLNSFIFEKLKLNKDIKLGKSTLINKISNYWGLDIEDDKDIVDSIEKWINDNNVNNIYPVADVESLKEASDFLEDSIINEYNTDHKDVKQCQEYLENAKLLYAHHERGENIDIMGAKDMICIIGWYGTLYCVIC